MPNPRLHELDRSVRRTLLTVGDELRFARLNAGLTQKAVARAIGCSGATVSRVERGRVRELTIHRLTRHASVVGLVVRTNLFPAGRPVRDAPQLRLLEDFHQRISPEWQWRTEVVIPIPGDLRALDAAATRPGCTIGIDAFTRLGDIQAQSRASLLKARDAGMDRLILLIRDTHANRRALRLGQESLKGSFPVSMRSAMSAMSEGRDPGGSGIVVL